ncbi:MAG TPA: hypothetical protein VJ124_00395 [Pyrinomonadaceae bacterium]|nr:hypothetical protein [Pyrinomonadaceae bacterium]
MRQIVALVFTIALLLINGLLNHNYCQSLSSNNAKPESRASLPVKLALPVKDGSVRFAVIGDTGTGTQKQQQLADIMLAGSPLTDKSFDSDMHFMLFEVVDDNMYFQVISRTGSTVDSGVMANQHKKS